MKAYLIVSLLVGLTTTRLFARDATAAPCVIEAKAASVKDLSIHPRGESSFTLTAVNLPMEARVSGRSEAALHVKAPLRFTTQHPWDKLGVVVRKRISLYGGRLIIPGGMDIRLALGTKHDRKRSDIPIRLPLMELMPSTPILVPCKGLTLSSKISQVREIPEILVPENEMVPEIVFSSVMEFSLYTKPKARNPWRIEIHSALKVLQRRGGWLELQAQWSDGSVLQGWAKSDQFSTEQKMLMGVGGVAGITGIGVCGSSHPRISSSFLLKANAEIHSSPKGAVWARTSTAIKVQAYPLSRSDGWMQVALVDGLAEHGCRRDHNRIWVHADSVQWTAKPLP